jgi:hypothetical protein
VSTSSGRWYSSRGREGEKAPSKQAAEIRVSGCATSSTTGTAFAPSFPSTSRRTSRWGLSARVSPASEAEAFVGTTSQWQPASSARQRKRWRLRTDMALVGEDAT